MLGRSWSITHFKVPVSSHASFPTSCFVCISLVWRRRFCFYNIANLQITGPSGSLDHSALVKSASLSIDTVLNLSNGSISINFFVFLVGEKSRVWYPADQVKTAYQGGRSAQLCPMSRMIDQCAKCQCWLMGQKERGGTPQPWMWQCGGLWWPWQGQF